MTRRVVLRIAPVVVLLVGCLVASAAEAAVGAPQTPAAAGSTSRLVRYAYFTSAEFLPIELLRITDFPAAFETFDPGKNFGVVFIGAVEAPAPGKDFKVRGVLRAQDGSEVASFVEPVKFSPQANWYPIRRLFTTERLRASTARKWSLDLLVDDQPVGTFRFEMLADPLWAQRPKKETQLASVPPAPGPMSSAPSVLPLPPASQAPPAPSSQKTQIATAPPAPSVPPLPPASQSQPSVAPLPSAATTRPAPAPPASTTPAPASPTPAPPAAQRPSAPATPTPAPTSPPPVASAPTSRPPAQRPSAPTTPAPAAPAPAPPAAQRPSAPATPSPAPPSVASAPTQAAPSSAPPAPSGQQIAALPPQTPTPPPRTPAPVIADTEPPKVVINYPPVDTKVDKEQILIIALATDNNEIASVQVSVNGAQQTSQTTTRAERAVPVRAQVTLSPGENVIEVTAIDKAGNASQMVRTVTRTLAAVAEAVAPVKHGERWAVIIGVGKYENSGIPTLKFAEKDATSLYDFLVTKGGFKKENVQILTDSTQQKPTLINIKRSLGEWLARRAGKDDTVVVYYAGHGAPEVDAAGMEADGLSKYLVPRDADPESLFTTGFPMDDIQRVFARLQAERVVFLVDTCFSGATGGRTFSKQLTRSGHLSTQFLDRLAHSRGRVIITAAGPNELALELPDLGHGVFTYYLLKGMEGEADRDKDGIVTVSELYEYLENKVSEHARKSGGRQRPIMKGEVEGTMPLIQIKAK